MSVSIWSTSSHASTISRSIRARSCRISSRSRRVVVDLGPSTSSMCTIDLQLLRNWPVAFLYATDNRLRSSGVNWPWECLKTMTFTNSSISKLRWFCDNLLADETTFGILGPTGVSVYCFRDLGEEKAFLARLYDHHCVGLQGNWSHRRGSNCYPWDPCPSYITRRVHCR